MQEFLSVILRMGFFGSLAALLLLLLRPVICRLAGWNVVYYLWLLVLLRFCVPTGVTVTLPAVFHIFDIRADGLEPADDSFSKQNAAAFLKGSQETAENGRAAGQEAYPSPGKAEGGQEAYLSSGKAEAGLETYPSPGKTKFGLDIFKFSGETAPVPDISEIFSQAESGRKAWKSSSRTESRLDTPESSSQTGSGAEWSVFSALADISLPDGSDGRTGRLSGPGSAGRFCRPSFWFFLWASGALAYFGWHVFAALHFTGRVKKSLSRVPGRAEEILKELEPAGRIGLAESALADTPMLTGVIHPVIVLPAVPAKKTETATGSGWEGTGKEDMLRGILAHELVHARRFDLLYKWLVTAVSSLYWFHPLFILIRREISRSCELSCDEAVIRGMSAVQRRRYGETLLAVAGAPPSASITPAASLAGEKGVLKERLVTIAKYRRKKFSAMLLSILPVLAVSGCAFIYGAKPGTGAVGGRTQSEDAVSSADSAGADSDGNGTQVHRNGAQPDGTARGQFGRTDGAQPDETAGAQGQPDEAAGTQGAQTDGADAQKNDTGMPSDARRYLTEEAADDYRAVMTDRKQIDYYAQDSSRAEPVNLTEILDLFSPDSSFVQIYEFAALDLDGDKEAEVILHITDVAGDMGGFMILKRADGRVRGYQEHYKSISSLKTDGTFIYMALARPDTGIGTVRFQDNSCRIELPARSETSEDFQTVTYKEDGIQISEEQYQEVLERHKQKPDAAWYRFTEENIYRQMQPFHETEKETRNETETQERFYEKDGRQYELVPDLVSGRYVWASAVEIGSRSEREKQDEQEKLRKLGKISHTDKPVNDSQRQRYFEKLDGTQSLPVRRWDNLRYSAGEYLVFEYNGTMHVSRSTDLYHPVLSYDCGGTYSVITKVPQGYMVADSRAYEIRFYDEQFRETKVITGMRAAESGLYYENGLMEVRDMNTGYIGYINQKGELVIPCRYAAATYFSNGFASVLTDAEVVTYTEDGGTVKMFYGKGGMWGIIDRKGEFILKPSKKYANESPDSGEEIYSAGVRRFGPVREDGTVDFIAQDQDEKVLETVKVW